MALDWTTSPWDCSDGGPQDADFTNHICTNPATYDTIGEMLNVDVVTWAYSASYTEATSFIAYETITGTCQTYDYDTYVIIPEFSNSSSSSLKCFETGSSADGDLVTTIALTSSTDHVYLGPEPFYKFTIDFEAETCDIMFPN